MPFDGNGHYSLPAGNPVVTGTVINSTTTNNTLADIAAALSTTLTKDGQSTPTGNLPLGGFKITGAGAGTSPADYTTLAQMGTAITAGGAATLATLATTSGASLVGFQLSAIGSVARTLQDELSIWVHAKSFGAIGDGSSHALSTRYASLAAAQAVYPWVTSLTQEIDTTAIDAAARVLTLVGGGNLILEAGSHFIWKRPNPSGAGSLAQRGIFLSSWARVQAYGAILEMQDNCDFFTAFPATVEKLTITGDVALNDVAITCAAPGSLATGDKVFVRLNTAAYDAAEPANWYWSTVVSVVGTTVTLDRPAPAAMSVAGTTAGNRQIVKASDVSNVVVEGCNFVRTSVAGNVEGCVNAQYVHGLTVRNCQAVNCGAGLLIAQYTENVKVDRIYADGIAAESASKGRIMSLAECDGVEVNTLTVKNFSAPSAAIVVEASCVNVNFRNIVAGCDGTGGIGNRRYVFSSLGQGPFSVDGLTVRGLNIYPSTGSNFIGQPRMRNVNIWAQYTLAGGSGPLLDDLMLNGVQYTRRTVCVRAAIPTSAGSKAINLPSGRVTRSRILASVLTGLTFTGLRRDAAGTNNGSNLTPASANLGAELNFDYVDVGVNNRNFNDNKQAFLTYDGTTPAGNFVYMQLEMLMRDGLNEVAGTSLLTYIDA